MSGNLVTMKTVDQATPARVENPGLQRVIGVPGVAANCFNAIVGVGIFALPGAVAGVLGSSAIIAYAVCLVLVALVALCFAEAGSRVSASGGMYAFADAAFGRVVAGTAGIVIVIAGSMGTGAAVVRYLLDIVGTQFPALASFGGNVAVLAVLYGFLSLWNVRGTRLGSGLTVAMMIVKLVPLAVLAIAGIVYAGPAVLVVPPMPPLTQLGAGTLILTYAFIGVDGASYASGETRDPARSVPRAIALAVGGIAVLYIALHIGAQGVLGSRLANAQAPLLDLAGAIFGPWGRNVVAVTTVLSLLGYIVYDMLTSPRVIFALAEAGQLPRALAQIHPRYVTPSRAIPFYATGLCAVALSGSFRQLAVLGTAGMLLLYMTVALSVLRMRKLGVTQAGPPFVAPGGAIVPLATIALILWVLSSLTASEMLVTGAFVAVTAVGYAIHERLRLGEGRDRGAGADPRL